MAASLDFIEATRLNMIPEKQAATNSAKAATPIMVSTKVKPPECRAAPLSVVLLKPAFIVYHRIPQHDASLPIENGPGFNGSVDGYLCQNQNKCGNPGKERRTLATPQLKQ